MKSPVLEQREHLHQGFSHLGWLESCQYRQVHGCKGDAVVEWDHADLVLPIDIRLANLDKCTQWCENGKRVME
ncbi:hypothetical protein CGRA01v4_12567 [Colletotrichum graminicola]|nr:hypothetical protein CGRA01v4_12567 [Colletotrichum graminicola]